ncbi:HigA family addiction module antidote protein [bacterium]|nr:HigA family addiction module antidote protein [bacterium]
MLDPFSENDVSTPIHPGEILIEEFMKPLGLSQNLLARQIGVSPRRINEIVNGKRSITADTAYRLSRRFGTSEKFWMNLQAGFELDSIDPEHREAISGEVISVSKEEVKKLNLG